MIILAIDPGITGALAFYETTDTRFVEVYDMPILNGDVNPHEMWAVIEAHKPDVAIIEHVHPHPNEGVSSVWRFAAAYTTARIAVQLLNIPMMLISPAKWKRALGIRGGALGKEQSRQKAIETFPSCSEEFHLRKHHGRAEAALLAVYASTLPTIRNHHNEQNQPRASDVRGQ